MKYILPIVAILMSASVMAASVTKQFTIKQQISFSATTTAAKALDQNLSRGALIIQNNGSDSVFVKVGSTITGSEGIIITAGGNWSPEVIPTDEIWIKSNSGTQALVIVEGISQ